MHFYIKRVIQENMGVICEGIRMGEDWNLCVHGGDKSHIGSVVLTQARKSLTGNGVGVTSSVMNCLAHKEEGIARLFSERFAKEFECTVVCSCGIHIDHIASEQLQIVHVRCEQLLEEAIQKAKHADSTEMLEEGV